MQAKKHDDTANRIKLFSGIFSAGLTKKTEDAISRILFPGRKRHDAVPDRGGDHSSGTGVAAGLMRPTRHAATRR